MLQPASAVPAPVAPVLDEDEEEDIPNPFRNIVREPAITSALTAADRPRPHRPRAGCVGACIVAAWLRCDCSQDGVELGGTSLKTFREEAGDGAEYDNLIVCRPIV